LKNFWDTQLDKTPGYTVVEIMHKALADDSDPHKIRGMYIMGENPAMSDPDLHHARHAHGQSADTWWCKISS
jgi:formate dehydrogenase major subunit